MLQAKDFFVLGYFGYDSNKLDGQTVKTRETLKLFEDKIGNKINFFDTEQLQRSRTGFIKFLLQLIRIKILIYLPAQNNLSNFFPILYKLSILFRFRIYYFVIGGWLPVYIQDKQRISKKLRKISHIYTETALMKSTLQNKFGFSNVSEFPNFRIHNFEKFNQAIPFHHSGLKIVFMSRINRMKGIEMILRYGANTDNDVSIDFYGPINEADKEYFNDFVENCSKINYKGILLPENIYSTLCVYDVLVLPTQYYTEGLPGAIVDAYISGIPVIVTDWVHASEFVNHGITGYIVPFKNGYKEFKCYLDKLYSEPELLLKLKTNSLKRSLDFSKEKAWEIIKNTILQN